MATENDPPEEDLDPKDQDPPEEDLDPKDQDPPEEDPEGKGKNQDPEVQKAIRRRDAAIKARQKAEARVRELEEKYEKKDQDPVVVANRKLVAAEARVVLAAKGLKEKADQKALMDYLALDDVDVSPDGEVDSSAIEDRLEGLLEVVQKILPGQRTRTPKVDTRDRGGDKPKPPDAASKRRRDMLLGR